MGSEWTDTTVGALLEKEGADIQTGPFGTKLKASEYADEGVPVISVGEVRFGRLEVHEKTPLVPATVTSRMPEYLLRRGDIVFGRKGAVERSGLVTSEQDGWFLGSDGIRIRLPGCCHPRFVSYHLLTRLHKNWMIQNAAGTTMPSLNESIVKRIPLRLPPLKLQKSIAHILGTLDDKIELNRRMNVTLESMARALFKSWFVDFDPVIDNALAAGNPIPEPLSARAQTRRDLGTKRKPLPKNIQKLFPDAFVFDEQMGWIPEGWEVASLSELIDIKGGTQPPKSEWIDEPKEGYVRMVQIRDYYTDSHVAYVKETSKLRRCKRQDVMIARYGASVGRICWGLEGVYNVALVKCELAKEETQEFVRSFLLSPAFQDRLLMLSNRSAQAGFNKGDISSFDVAIPNDLQLFRSYQSFAATARESAFQNNQQSISLAKLRDTLLPKLLSGELRIPDAEKLVAGSL